ncbi:hypothetical protein BT93_C2245 [Corymbia citriodora subsp. variegata]|nr:hypothetical protein BT93_C2245 [Corymbia citriodora subsp. variegata]
MVKLGTLLLVLLFSFTSRAETVFQLMQGQQLRDWEHLLAPLGTFKLGFFSPGSSSYRYLGIWYSKLPHNPEAIWVADPNNPIYNSSGVLNLDSDGRLKITANGNQTIVVSSNDPVTTNVTLTLLDTGNLLLREVNSDGTVGRVLWQSFDYPSSTLLPGMKLGLDLKARTNWTLTSWLNNRDPAPGAFRLGVDPGSTNQLVIWHHEEIYWTSGAWENGGFQMAPELTRDKTAYDFSFVSDKNEKYFTFSLKNNSTITRWEINLWGQMVLSTLAKDGITWLYSSTSSCNSNGNYSGAVCVDQKPSACRNGSELFVPQRGYYNKEELPYSDHNSSLTLSDCHSMCWNNCSCIAFESLSSDGTGCEFWKKGGTYIPNDNFDVLYVLTSALDNEESETKQNHALLNQQMMPSNIFSRSNRLKRSKTGCSDFQQYSFSEVDAATDYFAPANKLGEGGFGPVYKGILLDGREIAVKRLSRSSGQGLEEFMNEITLIAELQHINLVKLLGCCIQGEEKMLIYEYMPNKSLDSFLFDPVKRKLLDWNKRLSIIEGVAQGLLYLHKYSRLKVIHRDLKASNILLDDDMNPKISDFGMARIFGQNESRANTNRVVGTYGYMSPEYAMKGIFSVKSDVFSFGVLLLETVTGRKNTVVTSSAPAGLIEQTWDLWSQGDILELMDPSLGSLCPTNELIRIIHVGLLCVQEGAADRPTMSDVISMITNDSIFLPNPKQAAYCTGKSESGESSSGKLNLYSINDVSITIMEAR